jgi:hypothetical protein
MFCPNRPYPEREDNGTVFGHGHPFLGNVGGSLARNKCLTHRHTGLLSIEHARLITLGLVSEPGVEPIVAADGSRPPGLFIGCKNRRGGDAAVLQQGMAANEAD